MGILVALLIPAVASANMPYLNGFEVDTGDFTGDGSITRVASGAGALGVPSSRGSWHAEITNLDGTGAPPAWGDSQYTYFGGEVHTYSGQFWQAVDVYVDLSTWVPTAATTNTRIMFQIDESPGKSGSGTDSNAETNFRFYCNATCDPGVLLVKHHATGNVIATIDSSTGSGWYTFVITWQKGTSWVENDATIYGPNGTVLGTDHEVTAGALNSDLGGNGYLWFATWINGFANDVAAIDNVRTGTGTFTPLPSSVVAIPALSEVGLAALGALLFLAGAYFLKR